MEKFSQSTSVVLMIGASILGTGLSNTVNPISTYSFSNNIIYKVNFMADNFKDNTSSASTLDSFDLIKAKYNISLNEDMTVKYLVRAFCALSLDKILLDLRNVIARYTTEIPRLTFLEDGENKLLLVTISSNNDIDKSLDIFDSIANEWFSKSSIEVNEVLFLDVVA